MRQSKSLPTFKFEKELWIKGIKTIGGIDEVGRGAFAGPVIAACVVFKSGFNFSDIEGELINDSKKLSAKKREVASIWIKKNSLAYGIGKASVAEINKLGIVKATEKAFRRAIKFCPSGIEFLLIDAFYIPNIKTLRQSQQLPIIKGDALSVSIAAASIIAKVYRDELMIALSKNIKYKKYSWNENKGYGTKKHREIIQKEGITKLHRHAFVRKLNN